MARSKRPRPEALGALLAATGLLALALPAGRPLVDRLTVEIPAEGRTAVPDAPLSYQRLALRPPAAADGLAPRRAMFWGIPADLNRISAEDLTVIRGVGPALAHRILEARVAEGRFRSWSQVDTVAGVGPTTLARLQERLFLGDRP